MSGFEVNKIVASILLAGLITMMVAVVTNALYRPKIKINKRGYQIEVADQDLKPHVEEEKVVDVAALMQNANAELGRDIVKKCLACHSIDAGQANKVGPHLWDVVGREKASVKEYKYSEAMQKEGGSWDEESLFHFLNKPSKFIKGTKMSFVGLSKPEDIVNLIAFLKTFVGDEKK